MKGKHNILANHGKVAIQPEIKNGWQNIHQTFSWSTTGKLAYSVKIDQHPTITGWWPVSVNMPYFQIFYKIHTSIDLSLLLELKLNYSTRTKFHQFRLPSWNSEEGYCWTVSYKLYMMVHWVQSNVPIIYKVISLYVPNWIYYHLNLVIKKRSQGKSNDYIKELNRPLQFWNLVIIWYDSV